MYELRRGYPVGIGRGLILAEMSVLLAVAGVIVLIGALFYTLLTAEPSRLAAGLRYVGPAVLLLLSLPLLLVGRGAFAGLAAAVALGWYARVSRSAAGAGRTRLPHVRTAAIEMDSDPQKTEARGVVLAGSFEGRMLGDLSLSDLRKLHGELSSDEESRSLLEAYLDGRFPLWREDRDADIGEGKGGAHGSRPMTKEEAYQVLGLEAGASAAGIRKAHRRLMQRLDPGIGRASALAARINEAKDVLLSYHH